MGTKPNKQEFWSERRRNYHYGILNPQYGYPETLKLGAKRVSYRNHSLQCNF